MNITRDQAKAWGWDTTHPEQFAEFDRLDDQQRYTTVAPTFAAPEPKRRKAADGMNKLERSFRDHVLVPAWLRREILEFEFEPHKLRLAGRCTYKPDFKVVLSEETVFVEVKGPYAREDSIIKLKVAAEKYPDFAWLLVRREGRHGWDVRRVDRSGIGRQAIQVPWIHGRG